MNAMFQQMFHTWADGGWVMGPLALLGVIMYGTAAHLLLKLNHRGLTKTTDAYLLRWVGEPDKAPSNMRE